MLRKMIEKDSSITKYGQTSRRQALKYLVSGSLGVLLFAITARTQETESVQRRPEKGKGRGEGKGRGRGRGKGRERGGGQERSGS